MEVVAMRERAILVRLVLAAALFAGSSAQAAPVVGTGVPATDQAAVQAAVTAGGTVTLEGTFSFAGLGSGTPARVITIAGAVRIVGVPDAQGALPLIVGGTRPFHVAAPGATVVIEGVRFQNPT